MLKPSLILLASLLAASPALAFDDAVFGNATCGQPVSCSSFSGLDSSSEPIVQMLAAAESCVSNNFGFSAPDGHFEGTMGMNSSRCFYPKPTKKVTQGYNLTPSCCLVESGGVDQCRLVCRLIGTR